MPRFRNVSTIYMKTTAKGDCNIVVDLNELKKEPEWIKEKKDGQNIRQFFVRRGDKNSIYEVWDDDDPNYPEKKKEEEEENTPF